MPDDALKRLGMGRRVLRIDGRNHHAGVGCLGRESAVAANDADDLRPHFFRILQGGNEVRADVLLEVAAAHGKDQQQVRLQAG